MGTMKESSPEDRRAPAVLKVALISSIDAAPTSAGSLVLYRHLVDKPEIRLITPTNDIRRGGFFRILRSAFSRLRKIDKRSSESLLQWLRGRWYRPCFDDSVLPDVVVTIAHGDLQYAALEYATRNKVPLVTIFHDWWPAIADVHDVLRRKLERSFREIYQQSSVNLCVSEGMLQQLGPHPASFVLPPIPPSQLNAPALHVATTPFSVHYSGNISDFSQMLGDLLRESMQSKHIQVRLRGNPPAWDAGFVRQCVEAGTLLPFVDRRTLEAWLSNAGALLVAQSFSPEKAIAMQTNFPSKLTEYCMYGRPIVIWGPEYGSAAIWGKRTGAAVVVTAREPEALMRELNALAENPSRCLKLAQAAASMAEAEFNPVRIQTDFLNGLRLAVTRNMYGTMM